MCTSIDELLEMQIKLVQFLGHALQNFNFSEIDKRAERHSARGLGQDKSERKGHWGTGRGRKKKSTVF